MRQAIAQRVRCSSFSLTGVEAGALSADQLNELVAGHVSLIRAVQLHGGMAALERFWADYKSVADKRSGSSGISVTPLFKVTIKRIVTQERASYRLISPKKQPLHRSTFRYTDIRRQSLHRISSRQRHRHTEPTITNGPPNHSNLLPQRVRNDQRTLTNKPPISRLAP